MSSKTKTKKTVVPKLRFPEFRDAGPWEVKQLGEVANDFLDGDWIESKDQSDYGIRLVQTGNIGVGKFIPKPDKARYISEETFKKLRCTEIYPGDCLISRLPDPAGRACLLPDTGERMVTAVDCTIVRFNKDEIIPYFFILLSQTKAYLLEVESHGSGSTRKRISRDNLSKIKLQLPSLPEQQKIADCLSSLDQVIELETKRLEALKAHKKGLMQQLFPREGETTPRLRFPEFRDAGPWEVKQLGEVFQERNERNGSGLELLSVTLSDGVVKASQLDRKNNASSDLSNYKKVYPNDIVYNSMRMWQGASGISKWHGIVSPAYTVVEPLKNHNSLFWAYYFKLSESIEKFARYSQGVTSDTWNLKFPAFSVIRMSFPSLPEQQKIAESLSSLDDVIELQTKKLEALKAHKKGLMQQLFPQEVG